MTLANPMAMIGLILGLGVAVAGLLYPFLGLLVFLAIHFIQPGTLIPALAPFRIELVYAAILGAIFVHRRMSTPGPSLWSNRIILGAVILLGLAAFSIPFAIWRGGALTMTISLAKHVAMLILIFGFLDSSDRLRKFLWLEVALMTWFAWTGMHSYMLGHWSFQEGLKRAEGLGVADGPNGLAGILLVSLPFLVALIQGTRNILLRLLLIACGALTVATMMVTGARIAFLGLIAISLYYVFTSRRRVASFAVVICLATVVWWATPKEYQQRYLTVAHYTEGGKLDASNQLRLQIWRGGWYIFLHHPILGVGPGQFPLAFHNYTGQAHAGWVSPHNTAIEVGCELGLAGLIVFGYFVIQIIKGIRFAIRLRDHPAGRACYDFGIACQAVLIAVLMESLVGHLLYRPYWYLLGGIVAANWALAKKTLADHPSGAQDDKVEDDVVGAPEVFVGAENYSD
jgi:O-antigen ligase